MLIEQCFILTRPAGTEAAENLGHGRLTDAQRLRDLVLRLTLGTSLEDLVFAPLHGTLRFGAALAAVWLAFLSCTRTTFRHLRARATPAAARAFRRSYYRRMVRQDDRRTPLTWASVPSDYAEQIRALRRARGLSQAQLATLVGAAQKAVVYQWEARKRTPSPVFWQRITALHQ